jgi:hypothetical protein
MLTAIRVTTKFIYGLIGSVFLVAGVGTLLVNTGLLPAGIQGAVSEESRGDLNTLHILQELGCLLFLVGMITLWFVRHYERSLFFHWSMTIFWFLVAWVHWFDVRGPEPDPSIAGAVIIAIPFALFVLIGLMRMGVGGRESGIRHVEQSLMG